MSERMNRQQHRQMDKAANKSIAIIRRELAFLNAAGNPKYKLVVQSDLSYKAGRFFDKMAFWR